MKKLVNLFVFLILGAVITASFLMICNIIHWTIYGGRFFVDQYIFQFIFSLRILGVMAIIIMSSLMFWSAGIMVFGRFIKVISDSTKAIEKTQKLRRDIEDFKAEIKKKQEVS